MAKKKTAKKKSTKKAATKTANRSKGYIHLYTGEGGGKTTAALGVAMRAVGQGMRVAVVQFMKGRKDIGEWKIQKKLGRNFVIYQFGRKEFVNLHHPSDEDVVLANEGLGFAKAEMLEKRPPDLLILDEINIATAIGLLHANDVVEMLKKRPRGVDIYLTGRWAPAEFKEIADFITEVEDKKRPEKMVARKGIDY
ncbi:cob(I)yrinic acid a,c-diamide adenosyltransferase [Candidatus Woesearchaeota archaeon]|nr:cob(I)yrinic acid a,c-diamide adenosyltransferase [Candidatus Woesearchaeota archaeon]